MEAWGGAQWSEEDYFYLPPPFSSGCFPVISALNLAVLILKVEEWLPHSFIVLEMPAAAINSSSSASYLLAISWRYIWPYFLPAHLYAVASRDIAPVHSSLPLPVKPTMHIQVPRQHAGFLFLLQFRKGHRCRSPVFCKASPPPLPLSRATVRSTGEKGCWRQNRTGFPEAFWPLSAQEWRSSFKRHLCPPCSYTPLAIGLWRKMEPKKSGISLGVLSWGKGKAGGPGVSPRWCSLSPGNRFCKVLTLCGRD